MKQTTNIRNFIDIRKFIDRYIGIPLLFVLGKLHNSINRKQMQETLNTEVKQVLVIYLSGLGDTVMVLSCLRHIRKYYSNAEISILVSSQNHGIVKSNQYASRVFCIETKKGIRTFAKSFLGIAKELWKTGYDIVIDFEQFLRLSAIICLLARGKERIGFTTSHQYRHLSYSRTIYYSPSIHTFNNFVRLLGLLGIHCEPDTLEEIHVSKKDKAILAGILQHVGISNTDWVIGIHTGSGNTGISRRWGNDKFGHVVRRLITQYDAKIILTGTKEEKPFIDSIIDNADSRNNVFNFAGMVTLSQLPFLIKNCCAFLTNDTGPMHIAAAMNVPTVALFGPNTPLRYGPVGNGHVVIYKKLECSPCIIAHEGKVPYCKDNKCMQAISVDEVWHALESILSR